MMLRHSVLMEDSRKYITESSSWFPLLCCVCFQCHFFQASFQGRVGFVPVIVTFSRAHVHQPLVFGLCVCLQVMAQSPVLVDELPGCHCNYFRYTMPNV